MTWKPSPKNQSEYAADGVIDVKDIFIYYYVIFMALLIMYLNPYKFF